MGIMLANCNNTSIQNYSSVEKISLDIGHFFQVQDDYLDCYGDAVVTGKIGTDIQDSKCSWLFVKAIQHANENQKNIIIENYGQNDPVKIELVKEIYNEI